MNWLKQLKSLDLQAKVLLILLAVTLPMSLLGSLVQSRLTAPLLNDEVKTLGLTFAQNLATQIDAGKLFSKSNITAAVEDRIQRLIYFQPSIARVDVFIASQGAVSLIASSVEEDESSIPKLESLHKKIETQIAEEAISEDSEVQKFWAIFYPVESSGVSANIRVLVSLRLAEAIQNTLYRFNMLSALVSTLLLILILSFFLRRAIVNEKQLRVAQSSNEELTGRLQETQRELIRKEKLAAMGQLTAQFAHEIGTPLNAVSGHLQLLSFDLEKNPKERIEIISGQVKKIESIVKAFLQTTSQSTTAPKELASVHEIVERVLALVMPTLQKHGISFGKELQAKEDSVEVVPIEIEQVVLNLVNNAIDSMKEQRGKKNAIWIRSKVSQDGLNIEIQIEDTGTGISKENMGRIFKPFFTTKATGEGHGLGLSICQQIVKTYGGEIKAESKLKRGTMMTLVMPLSRKGS